MKNIARMFEIPEQAEQEKQRQLQRQEEQRKKFVTFQKPEGVSIVKYMESLPNKDIFTKNYLMFMNELAKPITAKLTTSKKVVKDFPDNIIGEVCEDGCNNHHFAILCTMRDPSLRPFFGFVDEYREGKYFATHCYSFHLSKDGKSLFDMTAEFEASHLGGIEHLKNVTKNYSGVEIPFLIIKELWNNRTKGYPNLAGYIKNKIFTSEEETVKFIKRIKSLQ